MTYTPRLPLKKHQIEALKQCAAKPSSPCPVDAFSLLMDMGTGKSATVLAEWGDMATNGGPRDLLLIAPKSSIRNWYADKGDDESMWSEIRKHMPGDFQERLIHHTWIGDGVAWRDKMVRLMAVKDTARPRALFINVEALSNGKNDDALNLCLQFVEQRGAMVVVDESTTIKGNSTRTDAVIRIGEQAPVKRILSGLWTPNSPLDLFYQCMFLDPRILGHTNFYSFRRRYATMVMMANYATGRNYPQITGYVKQEELRDKVNKYSFRVLKKDCLDLEPKIYTSRDVELTAEQKRMLKEIRNFGHARIETGGEERFVTTDMIIKRIIRELQIGLGYVVDDEERVLHEVPENRTKALLEVLEEHVGKAIIWCPWRVPLDKVIKTLEKEYGPRAVAQFHGGNVGTRGDEEKRFLNAPDCRYMCATQAAGMRGNNWTVANLVVYYGNNYDLEMRDQSEDRCHRIGQTNRVTYVDLISQGTIENKVIKALRKKIDLATMINREGHRAWLI